MALVATLIERRPAIQSFRRALTKTSPRVVACRSPAHLARVLSTELVDLIVLSATPAKGPVLQALRREYPIVPVMLYAPLRSDDAELLLHLQRGRAVGVVIEGMDEPILSRRVVELGLTAKRVNTLMPLSRRLELMDPLQIRTWEAIIRDAPMGIATENLAKRFQLTRETLSRRFAEGGAPSLKRAIDAVRLFAAGQLLGNPSYQLKHVAQLLGFSSVSLLHATARRTFGVSARGMMTLTDDGFVKGLKGHATMRDLR